ncbi:MAG: tetratricopeptide repeat protein, partial [Planctomycetota bacterium]
DLVRELDKPEDAIRLYQQAIDLAPDQPQYREYLGEYLHRLDRKDEALEVWQSIAAGDRRSRDFLIRLGEVYAAFDYAERSSEVFAEAMQLDPTFAQRLRFAELLRRAESFDQAIAQLDAAELIAETPDERDQVFVARVDVYRASGSLPEQIASLQNRLPEDEPSAEQVGDYRRLALMLDAAGRSREAIESISIARQLAPRDPSVLSVAASLLSQSSDYAGAVEVYRMLAEVEMRYQSAYLQQIASLQMRMGQVDAALQTGRQLISVNASSPDAYRYFADLCERGGRPDEAIAALRKATQVAPRDSGAKNALASVLAQQFRTYEAIELYWETLVASDDLDDQRSVVSRLVPLYERRGNFAQLLSRLTRRGREDSDMRTATLLISEAQRQVNDFGSAADVLQPLLAEDPRDPELLEQMVGLFDAMGEFERAIEYQRRLASQADTPENRQKLLLLMVDTGEIDHAELAIKRLQSVTDPLVMAQMIDRLYGRGNNEAAIRTCRAILERNDKLWGVRLRLAGMLTETERYDDALLQIASIRSMNLPLDTRAVSAPLSSRATRASMSQLPQPSVTPLVFANARYDLARALAVGRYASASYFTNRPNNPYKVSKFGEALFATEFLRAAIAERKDEWDEHLATRASPQVIDELEDADALWSAWNALTIADVIQQSRNRPASQTRERQKMLDRIAWRLAEYDSRSGDVLVSQVIGRRYAERHPMQGADNTEGRKRLEPLTDEQLKRLIDIHARAPAFSAVRRYIRLESSHVYDELIFAGKTDQAERFKREQIGEAVTLSSFAKRIEFANHENDAESFDLALSELAVGLANLADTAQPAEIQRVLAAVTSSPELVSDERVGNVVAVQTALAAWLDSKTSRARRSTVRSASGSQAGKTYVRFQTGGRFEQVELTVPLQLAGLDASYLQTVFGVVGQKPDGDRWQTVEKLFEKQELLFEPSSDVGRLEARRRELLWAYLPWWRDEADVSYSRINQLVKEYPEEDDLRIEQARLAAELKRPAESLAALDSITPLNQATLQTREMAALNLSIRLGKLDRAREAARRLFGMRLPNDLQLSLAEQMNRLGLKDQASAILRRNRRMGGQSVSRLADLARRYSDLGQQQAAAEIAFSGLRRLRRGRYGSGEYYREQLVEVLRKVGRLDKLIERTERRASASAKSVELQTELAELYRAAGRQQDANQVMERLAKLDPNNNPRALISLATQLTNNGKRAEAVEKYLAAFQRDPSLLRQHYSQFGQAVEAAKNYDFVLKALSKIELERVDSYYLAELLRFIRDAPIETEAGERFMEKLMANADESRFGRLLRNMTWNEGKFLKLTQVQRGVLKFFRSDLTYDSTRRIWNDFSWSNDGELHGAIDPLAICFRSNEQLLQDVSDELMARKESDQVLVRRIATLLMLVLKDDHEPEELRQIVEPLLDETSRPIEYGLFWQVAQHLGKQQASLPVAVSIYEWILEMHPSEAAS